LIIEQVRLKDEVKKVAGALKYSEVPTNLKKILLEVREGEDGDYLYLTATDNTIYNLSRLKINAEVSEVGVKLLVDADLFNSLVQAASGNFYIKIKSETSTLDITSGLAEWSIDYEDGENFHKKLSIPSNYYKLSISEYDSHIKGIELAKNLKRVVKFLDKKSETIHSSSAIIKNNKIQGGTSNCMTSSPISLDKDIVIPLQPLQVLLGVLKKYNLKKKYATLTDQILAGVLEEEDFTLDLEGLDEVDVYIKELEHMGLEKLLFRIEDDLVLFNYRKSDLEDNTVKRMNMFAKQIDYPKSKILQLDSREFKNTLKRLVLGSSGEVLLLKKSGSEFKLSNYTQEKFAGHIFEEVLQVKNEESIGMEDFSLVVSADILKQVISAQYGDETLIRLYAENMSTGIEEGPREIRHLILTDEGELVKSILPITRG